MSENWKIQVSPKLADGTLINLRAENPEQAGQILEWAIANATKIQETVAAFSGVSNVAAAFPQSRVIEQPSPGPWQGQQAQPAPAWSQQGSQQSAPPAAGKMCVHGALTFRQGVSKSSGKPYKAFFCPAQKGDPTQCPPEFVRD